MKFFVVFFAIFCYLSMVDAGSSYSEPTCVSCQSVWSGIADPSTDSTCSPGAYTKYRASIMHNSVPDYMGYCYGSTTGPLGSQYAGIDFTPV